MSGSSRRRQSKWDHREPEILSEEFHDRDPPRKSESFDDRDPPRKSESFHDRDPPRKSESFHDRDPPRKLREVVSPSRGSHRRENRSRERVWDREGSSLRMSPGIDEWRHRDRSHSPRNGRGRSYRSRSGSRSPGYNSRRESGFSEKGRGKSGAPICRDFPSGRCRRGNHCQFLHQDAQAYDSRRPLGSSPPDDWESRDRRIGGSRYSPGDTRNNIEKSDRRMNVCNDFVKGSCRRGGSCKYMHHETAVDVFERGPPADGYRDRDNGRRNRDAYPNWNHDRDTSKRVEPLCKFFAAGNCRNGNRCRFSHQVQEEFIPAMLLHDDRQEVTQKFDATMAWEGPKWDDAKKVLKASAEKGWGDERSDRTKWDDPKEVLKAPAEKGWGEERNDRTEWDDPKKVLKASAEKGWGEERNDIAEVHKEGTKMRPEDESWSHDRVKMKQAWDAPSDFKTGDERAPPLQAQNTTNCMVLPASMGTEFFSGDMEISPRDVHKQETLYSANMQTPSLPNNISLFANQQATASEAPYDQHFQSGFQDHKAFKDPYTGQNPYFKEDKPEMYLAEGRKVDGNSNSSYNTPNSPINTQPGQNVFQGDQHVNVQQMSSVNPNVQPMSSINPSVQSMSNINPPPGQGQMSLPLHPPGGVTMQFSAPKPLMNVPPSQHSLQHDQGAHIQPMPSINSSTGHGQLPFPLHTSGMNGMQTSHNTSYFDNKTADVHRLANVDTSAPVSAVSTNHNPVNSEQLVQLSHLSATLAQLFESRPQLSSAVTPSGTTSNLSNATTFNPPVSATTFQSNHAPETSKQYDLIGDGTDRKIPNFGAHALPSLTEHKISDIEPGRESGIVNQQEPIQESKNDENDGKITEEESKAPENRPSDKVEDDGDEDGKKSKDTKGLRSFKFALADFVKELLKPSWKDGHVNKESYKAIVKKVVDKVIDTQGLQIPETKEKINQYLTYSKPKLEKLVQAYVGKFQKG